jgi:inorganic pyrophosphatase
MKKKDIPVFTGDNTIYIIIETPKGSHHKYAYDEAFRMMKLKDTLPEGTVFPYDFGFIPGTKGEDGDPMDALVLMDFPAEMNCLVECRVIGVIIAWQEEENRNIRNDRILAVPVASKIYSEITSVKDLNKYMLDQLQFFFKSYNAQKGKEFTTKLSGPSKALRLIKDSLLDNKNATASS